MSRRTAPGDSALGSRDLRELRSEGPDDLTEFVAQERNELARRWRLMAPIILFMIIAGEIAPLFTDEFPPNLLLSSSETIVIGIAYLLARRASHGRALEYATIGAGAWSGVYAGVSGAVAGGFASVHVLGMVLVISLALSAFPMPLRAMIATNTGALTMFFISCAFRLRADGRPLEGIETTGFYLVFLAIFTVTSVERARRQRSREFVAQRIATRLHRFAVEEVMCRHLPPRYVERVLSGDHPLNAPPERRTVTVLFADVVGFTPISERLAPEELAAFMARFYDLTAQLAFEHGATIDKFIGDAVMAILGAPEPMDPHEQAERALSLARSWHERVAELAAQGAPSLALRIGVHQDVVAVGSFGGRLRSDYTVLGRGVNIAARLEQRCRHGEVLLSEAVYVQLQRRPADLVEIGLLELKGIPDHQRCYSLPVVPTRADVASA